MEKRSNGMEWFLAGWLIALAANYLVGLDTGEWIPLLVSAVQLVSLIMIFVGIGKLEGQNPKFRKASLTAGFAIAVALGFGALQLISLTVMSPWISIAAIVLLPAGWILFLALTGLVYLGVMEQSRSGMDEKADYNLRYRWILFLTFGILYLVAQCVAILLTNENLPALVYLVPVAGVPALVAGVLLAIGYHRIGNR